MITAEPTFAAALAGIHEAAFPPQAAWDAVAFASHLALPGVFGLLHPDGGLILGRVAADEAEILTLAVVPSARRRGIGRALLMDSMDLAATRGAVSMFLEVAEINLPARALYAGAGFRQVGSRRAYYPDGADALVLRAPLPAVSGGAAADR